MGLARVASCKRPDPKQFDPESSYFDTKSKPGALRLLPHDRQALQKTRQIGLSKLRATPGLAQMVVLHHGSRFSITPVRVAHWRLIKERMC